MRQWVKTITKIIDEKKRPLSRSEIYKILTDEMGFHISDTNVGVQLNTAKKMGVIAHVRLPIGPRYYCNPEWILDGELKPEYQFNPFWTNNTENEPNKNQ